MLHLLSIVTSYFLISNLFFFQLFNIAPSLSTIVANLSIIFFPSAITSWDSSRAAPALAPLLQLFSAHSLDSATLAWLRFGSGRVRVSKFFGCVYCVHYGCVCVWVG